MKGKKKRIVLEEIEKNPRNKAEEFLKAYDEKLTADKFRNTVKVIHSDGSILFFENAFGLQDKVWYYIFTEHCGRYLFYRYDVEVYQYNRSKIKPKG